MGAKGQPRGIEISFILFYKAYARIINSRIQLEDPTPFDFLGKEDCTGYFLPVLLSLPAADQPIQTATLEGLKKVDTGHLQAIAVEQFSESEVVEEDLERLGDFIQTRIQKMQQYAETHPTCTLKDIVFDAVPTWKRDFSVYTEENESAEWIEDTLEWALEGKQ